MMTILKGGFLRFGGLDLWKARSEFLLKGVTLNPTNIMHSIGRLLEGATSLVKDTNERKMKNITNLPNENDVIVF